MKTIELHQVIAFYDENLAQHLADYLNFLYDNHTEYLKYIEWRKTPAELADLPKSYEPWCKLCRMLHDPSLPPKTYENLHSWWFDLGQCEKNF